MTPRNKALLKPMAIGALIAFALIALFLIPIKNPNPDWGKFWLVKPFIIVPLAGAIGGAVYYFIGKLSAQQGWSKIVATIISILIYLIGIWMGTVIGLDGTLWN